MRLLAAIWAIPIIVFPSVGNKGIINTLVCAGTHDANVGTHGPTAD